MSTRKNPIATEEQHAFERKALELFKHPRVVQTCAEVCDYWLNELKPTGPMREAFEWAFEEVMFGAVIWSLNQDPLYPGVVTITRVPHQLGDLRIPGSRWGIDNPDSIYRVIPISGSERYLIKGKVAKRRLTENYFTLWDDKMNSVDVLDGKSLVLEPDGSFTITVDSDPANGRPNHVRSSPAAKQFYIRDVILDWANDRANELSIERLGPPPSRPPFTDEEQLALTLSYLWNWAKDTVRWNNQALKKPANQFDFKIDRDQDGALRNQVYIMGQFKLADDEALVLDIHMGGAEYFIAPITNHWGTTNGIVDRNGSLNKHQSKPNADGSYTYVLSLQDPGVHNWLDPCGIPEGILTLRWAEFADEAAKSKLAVDCKVVKFDELNQHLPAGTPMLDADARARQLQERADSYRWRMLDH